MDREYVKRRAMKLVAKAQQQAAADKNKPGGGRPAVPPGAVLGLKPK